MQRPKALNYYANDRIVEITWSEDHVARYPTRHLRCLCECAVCVDERTGVRLLDPNSIPDDIDIAEMEAVGNYAVRFRWSDGHDTGIYSWDHLMHICPCPKCRPPGCGAS